MMRRWAGLSALLVLFLVAATFPTHPIAPAGASPVQDGESAAPIDTIAAAYTLLLNQYYREPDPPALLAAAWAGATGAVSRAGYDGDLPLPPDFPLDRNGAWDAFAAAYPSIEALAPAGTALTAIAFGGTQAMVSSLLAGHTAFLSPEQYAVLARQLGGDFAGDGLGLVLTPVPPWIVTEVAPESPAAAAGVRRGDVIAEVNGRNVAAGGRALLDDALAGPDGSRVNLTLSAPEGRVAVTVTRGAYRFPTVDARVLADGTGYLRIRAFTTFLQTENGPNVIAQVDGALAQFEQAGAARWVLDLRDNPGGVLLTANEILGRFLPPAVSTNAWDDRGHQGEQLVAGSLFRAQRPMAVLINNGTSGAAEMVAAALQAYGRAVVVGMRTPGVAPGWSIVALPNGAALQVAVRQDRLPGWWDSEAGKGVVPDVAAEGTRAAADYASGADPQLDAAVTALGSQSPPAAPAPVSSPTNGAALRALLEPYLPAPDELPHTPDISAPHTLGDLVLTRPEEYVDRIGPVQDAWTLAQTVQERGWEGSLSRFYGKTAALAGPSLDVTIDLYRTEGGAAAALAAVDAPQVRERLDPAPGAKDGVVAWRGTWTRAGSEAVSWRAGRAVVTVTYRTTPGRESFDPVLALANLVNARLDAAPIPSEAPSCMVGCRPPAAAPSASATPAAATTPVAVPTRPAAAPPAATAPPRATPSPAPLTPNDYR